VKNLIQILGSMLSLTYIISLHPTSINLLAKYDNERNMAVLRGSFYGLSKADFCCKILEDLKCLRWVKVIFS